MLASCLFSYSMVVKRNTKLGSIDTLLEKAMRVNQDKGQMEKVTVVLEFGNTVKILVKGCEEE